jgi:thioesterase domain-containing protein
MYGPTETTIWSLVARVEAGDGPVPLGRPIANTQVYVLDEHLQRVPPGAAGELHVGGMGVARGYLRRDELTAERFIDDPFSSEPGARLYKTGDRVRTRPDGALEFLGRLDNQVKLRGFRIELGEIEAALAAFPGLAGVAVVVREDDAADSRLVAYLIPEPGREPAVGNLRRFLQERLPDYMIPAVFVNLEAFPLTPNGKLDRRSLPAPPKDRLDPRNAYMAPRDSLELWLARLCEQLLDVRPIGVRDNLLQLGAHSLLLARLVARIQQKFGQHVSPALVLEAPTVEQMAEHLRQGKRVNRWISLVLLHPGGAGKPFFCVHGGAGGIYMFQPLASHVGNDRPVFALQPAGLRNDKRPHTTVEQMAAHYVHEIRTVQPQGPYLLGGFCLGGVVAYEMARQLREAGLEVGLVALIHAFNPGSKRRLEPAAPSSGASDKQKRRPTLSCLGRRALLLVRKGGGAMQHMLRWSLLNGWRTRMRLQVAAYRAVGRQLPPELRDFALHDANIKAELIYVPKPGQTGVAVFRTELKRVDPYLGIDPDLGWSGVVENLEIHTLPAVADVRRGILREPLVRDLAERLRACCRQAEGGPGATGLPLGLKPHRNIEFAILQRRV